MKLNRKKHVWVFAGQWWHGEVIVPIGARSKHTHLALKILRSTLIYGGGSVVTLCGLKTVAKVKVKKNEDTFAICKTCLRNGGYRV